MSRTTLAARVVVLCVLGAVLPGCGAPEQSTGEQPLPADGVIYESQGEIAAAPAELPDSERTASQSPLPTSRLMTCIPSHRGDKAVCMWSGPEGRQPYLVDLLAHTGRRIDVGEVRFGPGGEWSPDDRFFATTVGRDPQIVGILDVVTGDWRRLEVSTNLPVPSSSNPKWSPDSQYLLFDAMMDEPGADFQHVCLYRLATGEGVPIAVGHVRHLVNPFWGDRFVFWRYASGGRDGTRSRPRRRFFCRGIEGLSERPTFQTELLPHQFVIHLSVSPRGDAAAALCLPESAEWTDEGTFGGWTMHIITNPNAPESRTIPSVKFDRFHYLRWSERGDRIVACLAIDAMDLRSPEIAIVDTTTGETRALLDSEGQAVRGQFPRWIDGDRRIAYTLKSASENWELWCYVLASGETYRLYPFQQQ